MVLFTETLKQFLEHRGGDFSAPVNALFEQIPDFEYQTAGGKSIKFSLKEMFIHDNLYKEIGAETEELWEYYLETRLDEVVLEYTPKIDLFLQQFGKGLFNRTVDVKRIENTTGTRGVERETSGKNKDTSYVNPITKQSEKLTVQDVVENEYSDKAGTTDKKAEDRTVSESRLYSILGSSNTQLLKEVMELKNIYVEALHKLDNLFMSLE